MMARLMGMVSLDSQKSILGDPGEMVLSRWYSITHILDATLSQRR